MNRRDNYFSNLNREGYEKIYPYFNLTPKLLKDFESIYGKNKEYREVFNFDTRSFGAIFNKKNIYNSNGYYDAFSVFHERGSEAAMHMTKLISPLDKEWTGDLKKTYVFPKIDFGYLPILKEKVNNTKLNDYITIGHMGQTFFEQAWAIRGMTRLLMDMMDENDVSKWIFNELLKIRKRQVKLYIDSGIDVLWFGDDVGSQRQSLMSKDLYRAHIKPLFKELISYAKSLNKDIKIIYHSCGDVSELLDDIIETGIDVLNPVQPECMDFSKIHAKYKEKIAFHGTIGTQTTMPFGSPKEVKEQVFKNMRIVGKKGGLFPCPTHILEPEVPFDNVIAYVEALNELG